MKSLVYIGVATVALTMSISANAATESHVTDTMTKTVQDVQGIESITEDVAEQHRRGGFRGRRGGFNRGGFRGGRGFRGRRGSFGRTRFFGGFGFPFGGFRGSYIRPFTGFRLPTYWINPTYFIPNYSFYNLSTPVNGQIWSRYYNDAVLRDQQGFVVKTVNNVQWQDGSTITTNNPSMPIEGQVYGWSEGANVGGTPGGQVGTYQGQWTGQYVDEQGQQFQGQWNGTYTDENGEVFQGQWNGTTTGAPVGVNQVNQQVGVPIQGQPTFNPGVPQPINQSIVQNGNVDAYEKCLRGNGVTGAILGTLIGGVAGNRIAGRNARTAGTLIGGGVGALGGLAVERAVSNCSQFKPSETQVVQGQFPQGQFPQGQVVQGQFPQGQFPQGQVVQGQFPQGQFPQGQVVQGQFPQGQFGESENGEYAQCLRKRGITGTVLGALLGGVAGNRIAGRNARTAGTLIGGGLGAITGRTIEKAARKCDKKRVNRGFATQYYQPQVQYYWVSPGYYYPPTTTTVTVHQQAVQQEEVVEYETVGKTLAKPVKRLKKPRR